jgi:TolB-like protein
MKRSAEFDLAFQDMGEQQLKNIARNVRVYRVRLDNVAPTPLPQRALPDKPSILPFQDMSGDAEQDYFADGIVEEIITTLSRIRWLFVIARNSSGEHSFGLQAGHRRGSAAVLQGDRATARPDHSGS